VIRVNESSIRKVFSLPMGLPWDKEDIQEDINAKKSFFHPNGKPQEDKNAIKR
jgi:hypothetical protein